jgi:hypothetical protein
MRMIKAALMLLVVGGASGSESIASARHGGGSGRSHANGVGYHQHGSRAVPGVQRDRHGRIARSGAAKTAFKQEHPCPSTGRSTGKCPGYVIDHSVALKQGGLDAPRNMQWQRTADAKVKDRYE